MIGEVHIREPTGWAQRLRAHERCRQEREFPCSGNVTVSFFTAASVHEKMILHANKYALFYILVHPCRRLYTYMQIAMAKTEYIVCTCVILSEFSTVDNGFTAGIFRRNKNAPTLSSKG